MEKKEQHILLFFDVDGVLNNGKDHEKMNLLQNKFKEEGKDLFSKEDNLLQDEIKFCFSDIKPEERAALGMVGMDKLMFLNMLVNQYNTKNFLISSWGVYTSTYVTRNEMEKFFELKFHELDEVKGCSLDENVRLRFAYKKANEYAKKYNIKDKKQIKILYLDDMRFDEGFFKEQDLKNKFDEEFNVCYIHPTNIQTINSNLNSTKIFNFLNS